MALTQDEREAFAERMSKITSKKRALYVDCLASVDAKYGPWGSISEAEKFITEFVKSEVSEGLTIAVQNPSTGVITKYIRENGAWRVDGGGTGTVTDEQLAAKQDKLTEAQLLSVNSGITKPKIVTYDGYASQIASLQTSVNAKQPKLSDSQVSAVNSGITKEKREDYDRHMESTSNPHGVTKAQVGLGNVDNTKDADKPISTAVQAALNVKQNMLSDEQIVATESGITKAKVQKYEAMCVESGEAVAAASNAERSAQKASTSAGEAAQSAQKAENHLESLKEMIEDLPTGESQLATIVSGHTTAISDIEDKTDNIDLFEGEEGGESITITNSDGDAVASFGDNGADFSAAYIQGNEIATKAYVDSHAQASISEETTETDYESSVEFVSSIGRTVAKIGDDGVDMVKASVGGKELATQEYVKSQQAELANISSEITEDEDEKIRFDNNGNYVGHIDTKGIHAKGLYIQDSEDGEEKSVSDLIAQSGNYNILPDKIYGVVDDTQQIFIPGVNYALDPYAKYNRFKCNVGKMYQRYYEAEHKQSGEFAFEHSLYDSECNVSGKITSVLKVCDKPTSPASAINVLCVGASTTEQGQWAGELKRRLTETTSVDKSGNAAPKGLGLTNINFVGRKRKDAMNVNFEATGGWTWGRYLRKSAVAYRFEVTGVTIVNVGDKYKYVDTSGGQQTVTVTEVNVSGASGNILLSTESSDADSVDPVSSGTLTRYTETPSSDLTITYSSYSKENWSPFWDDTIEGVSFAKYATSYCSGKIDVCIIFLGVYNYGISGNEDLTNVMNDEKKFLDALHGDFPSCKVILCAHIGCNKGGIEKMNSAIKNKTYASIRRAYYRYLKAQKELILDEKYKNWVYLSNAAAEIDTENTFKSEDKAVNTRMNKTEKIGINGAHPDWPAYMQLADSFYRCFCNEVLS